MDRRTFIKTAVAGGAFLPTFATLEPPPKKKGESDIRVAVLDYGVAGRIFRTSSVSRVAGFREFRSSWITVRT